MLYELAHQNNTVNKSPVYLIKPTPTVHDETWYHSANRNWTRLPLSLNLLAVLKMSYGGKKTANENANAKQGRMVVFNKALYAVHLLYGLRSRCCCSTGLVAPLCVQDLHLVVQPIMHPSAWSVHGLAGAEQEEMRSASAHGRKKAKASSGTWDGRGYFYPTSYPNLSKKPNYTYKQDNEIKHKWYAIKPPTRCAEGDHELKLTGVPREAPPPATIHLPSTSYS